MSIESLIDCSLLVSNVPEGLLTVRASPMKPNKKSNLKLEQARKKANHKREVIKVHLISLMRSDLLPFFSFDKYWDMAPSL